MNRGAAPGKAKVESVAQSNGHGSDAAGSAAAAAAGSAAEEAAGSAAKAAATAMRADVSIIAPLTPVANA